MCEVGIETVLEAVRFATAGPAVNVPVPAFVRKFPLTRSYIPATLSLQILAAALVFAIYGGLVTAVLNITIGREKDNLIATLISAGINTVLNFIFIPLCSLYGAAITTCISEAFVFVFCLARNKELTNYLDLRAIRKDLTDAGMGSILIIGITVVCKKLITGWLPRILIIVSLSLAAYLGFLLLRENQSCRTLYQMAKRKISKK